MVRFSSKQKTVKLVDWQNRAGLPLAWVCPAEDLVLFSGVNAVCLSAMCCCGTDITSNPPGGHRTGQGAVREMATYFFLSTYEELQKSVGTELA